MTWPPNAADTLKIQAVTQIDSLPVDRLCQSESACCSALRGANQNRPAPPLTHSKLQVTALARTPRPLQCQVAKFNRPRNKQDWLSKKCTNQQDHPPARQHHRKQTRQQVISPDGNNEHQNETKLTQTGKRTYRHATKTTENFHDRHQTKPVSRPWVSTPLGGMSIPGHPRLNK